MTAMLSLDGVSADYGSLRVLFDVSLKVLQGEAVGIIGPNGAGKTTLLRVISGLVPLRGGRLTVAGSGQVANNCSSVAIASLTVASRCTSSSVR